MSCRLAPPHMAGRGGATGLVPGRARQRQRGGQKGGAVTGLNPTDRGMPGTKRHLVVDARGMPLSLVLTGANRHDSTQLTATLDAMPRYARADVDARATGPASCTPTRPTTTAAAAGNAAPVGSRHASPAEASRAVGAWDVIAGSWNGPWRGWPASVALPSATSNAPISTRLHDAGLRPRHPQPVPTVLLEHNLISLVHIQRR